ncbi:endonuclease/exonuclease/phosphatase family protein [Gemmobacter caeni]|uniref:Endonuclease/exonuclease/phosphatase family protein n=1 Tax=Gemmobacter caeni TaxID=589035 RepID=A0A2T6B2T3_9RHOB|nr:endonuclease/exonuclease/phosphatase family protein [Gemmobacter caeni]PTX50364.1 endonuclease/exonuclease/phosphatase family protein [Gemmobacter caeni]TWI98418.1 endonuclease/exonuclease/phosphatase family protein [Gemmobacter caeni]
MPAGAETLLIATWNAELGRKGPGLLLEEIERGKSPAIAGALRVIAALDADVLLLTGIDFDAEQAALTALRGRLAEAGLTYGWQFALAPNSGLPTGLDIDRDGRLNGPRDAMGYGAFRGQGGMALLSRLPVYSELAEDYTGFLWSDLPGALLPPDLTGEERAVQRLSSVNHWRLGLELPEGGRLELLAWAATPPVFDGPEDRNGRRNHDEAAFWLRLMDGALPFDPPQAPFVLLGDANLDIQDGDGRPQALRALLADPRLQDPTPRAANAPADPGHKSDPSLDTAFYARGLGGLRVDYILPSADLRVTGAGVMRPPSGPLAEALAASSRHFPVWVTLDLP